MNDPFRQPRFIPSGSSRPLTMQKLVIQIVKHPVVAVFVLAALLSVFLIHLGTLEIDSSAGGLIVEGDPESQYHERSMALFGSDTLTLVVIRNTEGDVFTAPTLRLVDRLTTAILQMAGVVEVQSLTSVSAITGEEGYLDTDLLVDYLPDDGDTEALERIRRRALANDLLTGTIVSEDGSTTAIAVYTEIPPDDRTFNRWFSEGLDRLIAENGAGHDIYQIGTPLSKMTFSAYIERDQRRLIPWSVLLLLVVLLVAFRNIVAVLLPILTGGLSILTTLGFMALMGYQVNVITVIIPSILIAVGCTEDVHMISRYFQQLRAGRSKLEAVMRMAVHSALPIALTSLTTFLGFATLATHRIVILRQFGIVSSFGLLANFVITIVVVPTVLRVLPMPRLRKAGLMTPAAGEQPVAGTLLTPEDDVESGDPRRSGIASHPLIEKLLEWLVTLTSRRPRLIALIASLLTILALVGCFRLQVNTDFISYFKRGSFIRERVERVNRELSGALGMNVVVESAEENGALTPQALELIAGLQRFMTGEGPFNKSISVADHVRILHREMHGGDPAMNRLPESEELIAQYLLLLGSDELKRFVSEDGSAANIAVMHNITGSAQVSTALESCRQYVRDHFPPGLEVHFTGEWVLVNASADTMVQGQIQSLGLALAAILVIMTILFLSFKAGAVAMVSNIIPIVFNFGLMGWLGIPLNAGTCMVAAIALGIAVDDTIHFMVRYQRELRETNDQRLAIANSLRREGEPIIFTSVALALGFGVLVLSGFQPTVHFGLLAAMVMIYALTADLLINPVILLSVQLITIWDFMKLNLGKDITRVSPVFSNLRASEAKKVVLLGSIRTAAPGELIMRQGERGREMYVMLSGTARVLVEMDDRTRDLALLQPGDLVGEMALLGEGVRSASVYAEGKTELLRIDEKSLNRLRLRFPRIAAKLFLNIARVLGDRLREQNVATT